MRSAELISIQRSAAMLPPGTAVPLPRESLLALVEEVLSQRSLLERLGTDLRDVARRSRAGDA